MYAQDILPTAPVPAGWLEIWRRYLRYRGYWTPAYYFSDYFNRIRAVVALWLRCIRDPSLVTFHQSEISSSTSLTQLLHNDLDILFVTESWHSTSSEVPTRRAASPGYSFCDLSRATDGEHKAPLQNHGGIVGYFKDTHRVKVTALPIRPYTFEALCLTYTTVRGQ